MIIEELLRKPEGKTLEFKRDLSSPDRVVKALVAFANAAGGVMVFGVEDGDRNVRGISDPMAMEERLASTIRDSIAPLLVPAIEIHPWRNTHVVAVEVYPGACGPYYVKRAGPERGVYVRVGSTNRQADPALIEEMRRATRHVGFDEQPLAQVNSEEVDFRVASELFQPFRKIGRRDMESLRLLARSQNRLVPTAAGIILFGKTRDHHFPDAWIQCGRFAGTDRALITDSAEYHEYPVMAIDRALDFAKKHSMHAIDIGGQARHEDRWSIPGTAVREAIINAVVHADYSQRGTPVRMSIFNDRLEVESPGLLPAGLTVDDILQGVSKIRNRVIARVFKELHLIEQWGSGIGRIVADCRKAGLPDPVFEEIATHFRMTIALFPARGRQLDNVDTVLIDLLRAGKAVSTASLARGVGLSTRAVRTRLSALESRGLISVVGTGPRDPKRKYYLCEGSQGVGAR